MCPLRVRVSCPVAASHTFTVSSVAGGGEPLAVGAERHAHDPAGVPLEGDVPRGHLSLPVEPFETSAIDAALVGRKLLVEPLLQESRLL